MGRFETEWLATDENLAALTDLSGVWIDRVHDRKKLKTIILDTDSSESPIYGEQAGQWQDKSEQIDQYYGDGDQPTVAPNWLNTNSGW